MHGFAYGTEPAVLNSVGVLDIIFVFALVLILRPKWTGTEITICVFSASDGLALPTACTGAVQPLENLQCNSH